MHAACYVLASKPTRMNNKFVARMRLCSECKRDSVLYFIATHPNYLSRATFQIFTQHLESNILQTCTARLTLCILHSMQMVSVWKYDSYANGIVVHTTHTIHYHYRSNHLRRSYTKRMNFVYQHFTLSPLITSQMHHNDD